MKPLAGVLAAAGLALSLVTALPAAAVTADDVAEKARECNWPETMIQAGYNKWSSGDLDEDELENIYDSLTEYSENLDDYFWKFIFGDDAPPETEPSETETDAPDDTPAAPDEPEAETPLVLTLADGTEIERIAEEDFIAMSYEEKQAYIAALDDASKLRFKDSLSGRECNSILKQAPTADQLALMESLMQTAQDMGMNVSVDDLSQGSISLTVRDEEGVVIEKTGVGTEIDETGISHTLPYAAAAGAALLALAGFGGIQTALGKKD